MEEITLRKLIQKEIKATLVEEILNEEKLAEELLEEGKLANWALAGLMTLGSIAGIGQTQRIASESDIQNAERLIQTIKSDPNKFKEELNAADFKLSEENFQKLKKIDAEDLRVFKTKSKKLAQTKLKKGYSIAGVNVKKDTVNIIPKGAKVEMNGSLDLKYGSNAFQTAQYTPSNLVKNELKKVIDSISNLNGEITRVIVESSTDAERIEMSNQELAKRRANSIIEFISQNGVDSSVIDEPILKVEQGKEDSKTSTGAFEKASNDPRELDQLRKTTQKYRYVKVIIDFKVTPIIPEPGPTTKIVTDIEYTLISKALPTTKITGGGSGENQKTHQFKCKKLKINGNPVQCPVF